MRYLKFIAIGVGIIAVIFLTVNFTSRSGNIPPGELKQENIGQNIFEPQTNDGGGVSITVLPLKTLERNTLEFKITLNTHSVELEDDLIKAAALIDEDGNEYKPISWEGDPPGGHHREGILKFGPMSKISSQVFTFKLSNVGGVAERNFKF